MKRFLTIIAMAVSMLLLASVSNKSAAQPGVDVNITYQDFYDELSPYGEWMDYPDYGYVWVPSAGPDFQPYQTNGHWVWSDDYEWMWVSDYDWGWAPFHYGRWFNDPGYGWMWMPGYEWAPAWVAWRDGGDYYGWAPLRPGFNISVNLSFGNYNPPIDYWCFAPRRYISSPRIYDYCEPRGRNITIINNTTIINNYGRRNNVFYAGPHRRDAERYTGRINPVRFRESNRPGRANVRRNEVSFYRPNIRRDDNRNFAPRKIERYDRNGDGRRNADNAIRRNDNNDRTRRDNSDRIFNRQNSNIGQPNNDTRTDRKRNIFDRNRPDARVADPRTQNNGRTRPDINRPTGSDRNIDRTPNTNIDRNRDRNDNNDRRNIFDRSRERQTPSTPASPRRIEPRRQESNPAVGNRAERRNVFERRSESTPQRQYSPAPQQREPRQMESRGGDNRGREVQRDNGGGAGNRGGGFGRRSH